MSDISEVEKSVNISLNDVIEIQSNKGKWKNIFIGGHKFTHQKVINDIHYYVCAKYFDRKCSCRLVKRSETDYQIRGTHCHPGNATELPRTEILQTLKATAKTDRSKASVLIATSVGTVNSQVAVSLPPMSQMSRTINRIRNAENIKIPRNTKRIELSEKYTVTKRGDNFLLFDNGSEDDRLLIFGTKDNLRVLKNCFNMHCDGTFDVTPPGFDQMYTIHGKCCLCNTNCIQSTNNSIKFI